MRHKKQTMTEKKQPKNFPLTIIFTTVSLLVAIIALAISLFNIKTSTDNKDKVTSFIQTQQSQLQDIQSQLQRAKSEMDHSLAKNDANLKQVLSQITNTSAEAAKSSAHYLIRLAVLNLHFSDDTNSSIRLLQLAQNALDKFHTSEIETLKTCIANDIATIKQLPDVNKAKLLKTLDSLRLEVQSISVLPRIEHHKVDSHTKTTTRTHNWWEKTKKSLASLKSLVIIRKIDDPTSLTLSPDKILITKEEIIFKLNQAQWAVLNNNNNIFQNSLDSSITMLNKLNLERQQKEKLLESLNKMKKVSLPNYVDVKLTALEH